MNSRLLVSSSPHLRAADSMPRIMWTVVAGLVPVVGTAIWFFGPSAVLVIGASTIGALGIEFAIGKPGAWRDGSAVITGVLLGLTLPASFPMWMAFVGAVFGVGVGKILFGGLGSNVFNPALFGRAFLQATFPGAITLWTAPGTAWWQLKGDNFAIPFTTPNTVHVITAATPLGAMKFEHHVTPAWELMFGRASGSLGETAGLVILLAGLWLAWRRVLDWRVPVAILATTSVLAEVLHVVDPARYADALFHAFSGGLMLGAVFMATDPVTCPTPPLGRWIFGIGTGVLVIVIRVWGGLPEGVMYAVLLMNAATPALNHVTQPRVFGQRRRVLVRL
ncbi:MAG: RnfABCDGE type electron transport complex subunit D [Gemmatimonadaceae bacterium]